MPNIGDNMTSLNSSISEFNNQESDTLTDT